MPSKALVSWRTTTKVRLNGVALAHAAVRAVRRSGRDAAQQLNQAYALLLSSHFQGFCRDLHSEAADHLCAQLPSGWAAPLLRQRLIADRRIDHGNPTPANLAQDFGRLGMPLWPLLHAQDPKNHERQRQLEALNRWRNAIAHQDFARLRELELGGGRTTLRLCDVRAWHAACDVLAAQLDLAVGARLRDLVGKPPWS